VGSNAQRAAPAFTAGGQFSFSDRKKPEEMNGHWLPGFSFDLFTGSGQKGKVWKDSYLTLQDLLGTGRRFYVIIYYEYEYNPFYFIKRWCGKWARIGLSMRRTGRFSGNW
jgi:hypothetical protein